MRDSLGARELRSAHYGMRLVAKPITREMIFTLSIKQRRKMDAAFKDLNPLRLAQKTHGQSTKGCG